MTTHADAFNAAVGAQIRAEAAGKRIAVSKLAKLMDMDRSTLIRYLDGARAIPLPVLFRAVEVIGIDAEELVRRAGDRMEADGTSVTE